MSIQGSKVFKDRKVSKKTHLHTYTRVRVNWKNHEYIYRCKEGCSTFLYEETILFKHARCPLCDNEYTIDRMNLRTSPANPNCGCRRAKRMLDENKVYLDKIKEIEEGLDFVNDVEVSSDRSEELRKKIEKGLENL